MAVCASLSNLHVSVGETTLKVAAGQVTSVVMGGGRRGPFWWIPDGRRVRVCLPYFFSFKAFFFFGDERSTASDVVNREGGEGVIIFWYLC